MRTHLSFISNQLLITNTFSFLCYSKDSFKSNPDSNVFFQVAVSVAASHPSIIHNPVLMRQLTPRDISQTARERPALWTHIRSESLQPSSLRPAWRGRGARTFIFIQAESPVAPPTLQTCWCLFYSVQILPSDPTFHLSMISWHFLSFIFRWSRCSSKAFDFVSPAQTHKLLHVLPFVF